MFSVAVGGGDSHRGGQRNGWMDGWMDHRMNEWIGGRLDVWIALA